jgi:hypothetical protein
MPTPFERGEAGRRVESVPSLLEDQHQVGEEQQQMHPPEQDVGRALANVRVLTASVSSSRVVSTASPHLTPGREGLGPLFKFRAPFIRFLSTIATRISPKVKSRTR